MKRPPEPSPAAESHRSRAIMLFLAAMLLFACLDATAKHLSRTFPLPMLVWARYTFHCLLMVVFLAPSMGGRLVYTRRPWTQIVRALMLVSTTSFGIAALKLMPLAETTALVFITPLLVTLLAIGLLGETVEKGKLFAVAAGFVGVLLIARPGAALSGAGLVLALIAALSYSLYQILTRKIADSENAVTMVFYTALVGTALMSVGLPWYWSGPTPSATEALLIGSLGIYGGSGHFLLTRAFRLAPASTLSPFLYVQLIWATLLGYGVFHHLPDKLAVAGMLVIAASGLAVALGGRQGAAGASGLPDNEIRR